MLFELLGICDVHLLSIWFAQQICILCETSLCMYCGCCLPQSSIIVRPFMIATYRSTGMVDIDILYHTFCMCVHWRCCSACLWLLGIRVLFPVGAWRFMVQFFLSCLRYELISFVDVDVCTDEWMCVLRSTSNSLMYIRCMGTDVSPPRLLSLTLSVYRCL